MQRAIARGEKRRDALHQAALEHALSEDEFKRRHTKYRLQMSDYIETCSQEFLKHFPGFKYEIVYGERGWGAACSRDQLRIKSGRRDNDYSRLELTVRPYSHLHIVEVAAKGTICNKEVFRRNYDEKIEEVDPEKFIELIDIWALEYAELYIANS